MPPVTTATLTASLLIATIHASALVANGYRAVVWLRAPSLWEVISYGKKA